MEDGLKQDFPDGAAGSENGQETPQPAQKPENPLGSDSIPKLMLKYSIPSVVSMLVMSLYNIVDQIFIGRGIGPLGNGATTVVFPLVTVALAISLLTGNGAAANISLGLGRGQSENAKRTLGNALLMLIILSLSLTLLSFAFLEPILSLLGATALVMPYAVDYTVWILVSLPFAMFSTAVSNVIRADGSPRYSMFAVFSGAVLNTILDPIFIFVLDMGMRGVGIATVIAQTLSFSLVLYYLLHKAKYVRIELRDLKPDWKIIRSIIKLGSSSFMNQISMVLVMLVLNRSLVHYGAKSAYGSEIPLAAVGIVMKINAILLSAILGVSIGLQPILGFNYGAGLYKRVRRTFILGVTVTGILALMVNIMFVTVPEIFINMFGDIDKDFNLFACHALSVFMACVFTAGIQIPSSMFFMATGRPVKSITLTLTRQVLFLIPLLLVIPLFFGLDGILYASPAADVLSLLVTGFFITRELRRLNENRQNLVNSSVKPS